MDPLDLEIARATYLAKLRVQSATFTLPIQVAEHGIELDAIAQQLTLRPIPLAAGDERHEELIKQADERQQHRSSFIVAAYVDEALALSPQRRIVVLGGPGMGKTTALKQLLREAIRLYLTDSTAPIPLFISLPDLARSGFSWQHYLPKIVTSLGIEAAYARVLAESVEEGRAFVCLDSLDEVAPALRPDIIAWINREAPRWRGTWIIGSRFTEYKGGQFAHGQFAEWELRPMNAATRLALARRILPVLQPSTSVSTKQGELPATLAPENFVREIEKPSQVADWAGNPLLFSLAAAIYAQQGMLPTSRALLYQSAIASMLKRRIQPEEQRAELLQLLGALALALHQTKGRTFALHELFTLLPGLYGLESTTLFERAELILQSGVLEPVVYESYSFIHQSFQEYLVARELAQQLLSQDQRVQTAAWELVWSKRMYSRWVEVLHLLVGILVHEYGSEGAMVMSRWLHALVDQRQSANGDVGNLGLALALGSLRECSHSLQETELASEIVLLWARTLLHAAQEQRTVLVDRLQQLSHTVRLLEPQIVQQGIQLLADGLLDRSYNNTVHEAVAQVIGRLGRNAPVDALLEACDKRDMSLHIAVRDALHVLGKDAAVEPILAFLARTEGYTIGRGSAIRALGCLKERAPLEKISAYLSDKEPFIRMAAAQALGMLGERAPINLLITALHDSDDYVRAGAIQALGGLGERAPVQELLDILYDTNGHVRTAVVIALGRSGDLTVPLEVFMAALHDTNYEVRLATVQALEEKGERLSIEMLMDLLNDDYKYVRMAATEALGKRGDRVPLAVFLKLLYDKSEHSYVRQVALQVLARRGKQTPVDALLYGIKLYDDHTISREILEEVVPAVGARGEQVPIPVLLEMLKDDGKVGDAAARILGMVWEWVPQDMFLATLSSADEVREVVSLVLGARGEKAPIELLASVLEDRSQPEAVRSMALEALSGLGEHAPIQRILTILDEERQTSGLNAMALQMIGALRALYKFVPREIFMPMLQDGNPQVRQGAISVLGGYGDQAALEQLTNIVQDIHEESFLRQHAASILRWRKLAPLEFWLKLLDDHWISEEAAMALAEHGSEIAREPLLKMLSSQDEFTRRRGVKALGELGEHAPVEPLITMLNDQDEYVRQEAAKTLGKLGANAPIEVLQKLLVDEKDWWMSIKVIEALIALKEHAPLDMLVNALDDSRDTTRKLAADTLEEIASREPTRMLAVAKDDQRPTMRAVRLRAWGTMGKAAPLAEIVAALDDPNTGVRKAAVEALGDLGENAPIEPLIATLNDEQYTVRSTALQTLAKMGARVPAEPLLWSIGDKEMGWQAVELLKQFHPAALLSIAADAEAIVRGEALRGVFASPGLARTARVIGRMKQATPTLLARLAELLDWPYWAVRYEAIRALGNIQRNIPDSTIQHIFALRHEPHSRAVREAADDALLEILSLETGIEDD